ncbi:MAG TPA: zinc ribbon domain-containing protein [Spirochaetes bacterium]|nr:zinc ribbon domain-containing protein [Spirochaetota bacterium]
MRGLFVSKNRSSGADPMPIFEYSCKECKNIFELFVRSTSESISCPECHGEEVAKLFSTFAHRSTGSTAASSGAGCGTCSSRNCASCG